MVRHDDQDRPPGGEASLAEHDDTREVPHQRRARRVPLLRRPESLRTIPSLARFLRPAAPAGRPTEADQARQEPEGAAGPSEDPADGRDGAGAPSHPDDQAASAAELRELAELADLLTEVAGLVRDLGTLIVGLVSAAADRGEGRVRTFTMPPALAELAVAHQELKTEQQSLNARFAASDSAQERAALRSSLAALTERATRAVAAAAAAVAPPVGAVAPEEDQPAGKPLAGTTKTGDPGTKAELREPSRDSREETGVQSTTGGTPTRGPARWGDAPVPDRRLAPVAVALDAPDIEVAAHWATVVTPHVSTVKIGLELYLRYGPTVVATVRGGSGVHVFLDLKLHDIPNTVAGAARAVSKLHPEILTVHAAGGSDMIKAAVEAAPDTIVAGVTLLTSIGDKDLAELGVDGSVSDAVRRMAALAVAAGARGLVCSPQEVSAVRAEVGEDILLITPGIRPAGATSDDQARVATPEEALKAGADLLVIGRPITKAPDPGAAAATIAASLRRAVLAP